MKIFFRVWMLLCLFTFSLIAYAQTEKYVFDPAHTYVVWTVNHFGFSNPSGKWMAEGTLWIDENKPENSKLQVSIKLPTLVTGIPKFDEHLKSADFFEVAKYPIATFVSKSIRVTGSNTAQITGLLTLHDVTKSIVLDVKLNKIGISPMTQKKTAGFSATTTIRRSDFNLGKFTPGVSDDVTINIEAEANKVSS